MRKVLLTVRSRLAVYSLLCCTLLFSGTLHAQQGGGTGGGGVVKGRVLDARTKQPLPGSQVWLVNTEQGTTADVEGNFSIEYSELYSVIQISFLGYETKTQNVMGITNIVVELEESLESLEDVVVVGYGTQKRVSVVGAISTVPVQDINRPVSKISNTLAGNLAGVITIQRSGEPGTGSTFWIRGVSTFGENAQPLVLVDGVERELDLIDPNDIADLSILKDASATAIYGVKGANGVILVTTRRGLEGKPRISLTLESGLVSPTKVPKMANSMQWAEMWNESVGYKEYTDEMMEAFRTGSDPDRYPNTDWMSELYKNFNWNHNLNLSVSGGSQIANYYISGGFYRENNLFKTEPPGDYPLDLGYQRFNFRTNVNVRVLKHTTLKVGLATAFERSDTPQSSAGNIWNYALTTSPSVYPAMYSNGYLPQQREGEGWNPYVMLNHTGYTQEFFNTAESTFEVEQDLGSWITPGLTLNLKGAFDAKNSSKHARTAVPTTYLLEGVDEDGENIYTLTREGTESLTYSESNDGNRRTYLDARINYARTFGKHAVSGLFLYQHSQRNNIKTSQSSEEALQYRHQGIAGRFTYAFDNRYFLEGNFGYNGSENFAPGKRFGFFPSVAAGWVVSEEAFWGNTRRVIDMLKFRASYGKVGNDQIGGGRRFIYNETVTTGNAPNFGTSPRSNGSLRLNEYANPNVGWEESLKLNVGIDLSLFNKLRIQADYFEDKKSGIFWRRQSIPNYVGITTMPYVNIGEMNNKGTDLSVEYYHTIGEVDITVRGNFTYARNKIVNQDQPDWAYMYRNERERPLWQKFGYVAVGLFTDQDDIDAWATQKIGETPSPGDIKYLDLNGDGVVDSYDMKAIGYRDVPEIVYGAGATIRWRSWDVSFLFQGIGHVEFLTNINQLQPFINRNKYESGIFADLYGNHWTAENPDVNAKYPRLTSGTNTNNNQPSTFWMVNGRYVRLKFAELGYTLPKRVSQKIGLEALRIYFSGVNLFTFSPFKLWDPDLQTGATNYPTNRVFNIGISLNL